MDLEPGGFTSHNTYEDIYIYIYIYETCAWTPNYVFVIEGCGKTMGNPRNASYWRQLG
jgi:hypothetical protein